MKFSTRAEYGLKAMANLADVYPKQKSVAVLAQEEGVSEKYLERLMGALKKRGLVASTKGKSGGYSLAVSPKKTNVREVIEVLEGHISPMACDSNNCVHHASCSSAIVWGKLEKAMRQTLEGIKLSDLIS